MPQSVEWNHGQLVRFCLVCVVVGQNVLQGFIRRGVVHHAPVILCEYPALTLPVVTNAQAVEGLFQLCLPQFFGYAVGDRNNTIAVPGLLKFLLDFDAASVVVIVKGMAYRVAPSVVPSVHVYIVHPNRVAFNMGYYTKNGCTICILFTLLSGVMYGILFQTK